MAFDPNNAEDAKLLEQKIAEAVAANDSMLATDIAKLKAKNEEVIGEKRAADQKLKDVTDKIGDRNIDDMLKTLSLFEKSEDAQLIAAGKLDEVVGRRMERAKAEYEGKLAAAEKISEKYKADIAAMEAKIESLVIDQAATAEFIAAGGIPEAVSDAVFRARQMFKLEDGEPVPRDKAGMIVKGASGALTIKEYMSSNDFLKGNAKHLYGTASGGGAGGNNTRGGDSHNPWSKDHFNLTRQGEIMRDDPGKAARLKASS